MMMTGIKFGFTSFNQCDSLCIRAGKPLEENRSNYRPSQRTRHALPLNRWTGMQDQMIAHAGNHIARSGNSS